MSSEGEPMGESNDRRDDPAFVVGMFCGQFSAGAMRMVSKYAVEGSLRELVDEWVAGRVRFALNANGTLDVESTEVPPSGN